MKKTEKTSEEKEAIIAEYLLGKKSYRQLGLEYDVDLYCTKKNKRSIFLLFFIYFRSVITILVGVIH
jgi:hypothetical protein